LVEKALAGLKIVELGEFISAPYCSKLMADLGAEVIKVERPGSGDESRQYGPFVDDIPDHERSGLYLYLNSSKMGVTLDIGTETGQGILKKLITEADIFVENRSPGEMDELGLDYPTLKHLNPGLIVTSITPFGQTGPYRDYRGYAINTAGLGGHSMRTGEPTREPLSPPLSQSHYQGGAMGAASTMGAVFARMSSGTGQHVDISESDVWATIHLGHGVHLALFEGRKSMRAGHRTISVYPWCVLACKDGYMGDPRFKNRILMAMEHADELDSLVQVWLLDHTKEEVFAICREQQITFAPVRDIAEVARDPHEVSGGTLSAVGVAVAYGSAGAAAGGA